VAIRVPQPAELVTELGDLWIPLPDGSRLAARLWLPPGAEADPVPAVVEASPYRHEDNTRRRDAVRHPFFAEHGYASLRIDLRGSGASDGVLRDEYTEQEQQDVCDAIAWIAAQPWCTGSVGMIGLSWGGFAALQAAARRPPALKAVVAACASADRYGADVKYHGGCVLACELLPWSSTMLAMSVRPPDPELLGPRWRELWLERLEEATPFAETWLEHQRRDDYWASGSPCEDYSAIECAVYAVGGWADPYRQAVLDLLEGLSCPRKGLIGPWSHRYPEEGTPGPAFDFRPECVRWWDHWLKGVDTGLMDEPMLHAWMQEPASAEAAGNRPGRWVAEERWPSLRTFDRALALGPGTLGEEEPATAKLVLRSPESTGLDAGAWCPWTAADLPADQAQDDELSLTFTSEPLEERLELLGAPVLEVELASDRPHAQVAARLCDVSPSGESSLVTRGLLNLAHRDNSSRPEPVEPGTPVRVRIPLEAIGYAFPPGHRLRFSLSSSYWPWAWPAPEAATLTVGTGGATLGLPTRPAGRRDAPPSALGPPPAGDAGVGESTRVVETDAASGLKTLRVDRTRGRRPVSPSGPLEIEGRQSDLFSIVDGDPLSAEVECERRMGMLRDGWSAHVETQSRMRANAGEFVLEHRIEAFENGELVYSRERAVRIPRDCV
jgi:putative CocE/NonD family hydrolase